MGQTDSGKACFSRNDRSGQDAGDHLHSAGSNSKNGKAHSLNCKTHRIHQSKQTVAAGAAEQKPIGIGNDLCFLGIHKQMD